MPHTSPIPPAPTFPRVSYRPSFVPEVMRTLLMLQVSGPVERDTPHPSRLRRSLSGFRSGLALCRKKLSLFWSAATYQRFLFLTSNVQSRSLRTRHKAVVNSPRPYLESDAAQEVLEAWIATQAVVIRVNTQKLHLKVTSGVGFFERRKRLVPLAESGIKNGQLGG